MSATVLCVPQDQWKNYVGIRVVKSEVFHNQWDFNLGGSTLLAIVHEDAPIALEQQEVQKDSYNNHNNHMYIIHKIGTVARYVMGTAIDSKVSELHDLAEESKTQAQNAAGRAIDAEEAKKLAEDALAQQSSHLGETIDELTDELEKVKEQLKSAKLAVQHSQSLVKEAQDEQEQTERALKAVEQEVGAQLIRNIVTGLEEVAA